MQNNTAVNIIAKVVMASDHKSTRSIKIKLKKVKTANLIPLVLKAKIKKIKIIIGNGIKLNNVSKLFKTLSIGADNFLKSGLCVKSHSLIFFSIHSEMGIYISKSEGANFKLTLDYFNQLSKVL